LVVLMAHKATRADSIRPLSSYKTVSTDPPFGSTDDVQLCRVLCAQTPNSFYIFFCVVIIFIMSSLLFFYVLRVVVSVAVVVAVAIHTAFPFVRHTKTRRAKK